jgi:large subunit ribosomal protein L4
MKAKVYSLQGKSVKEIELDDSVFGIDVSEGAIYHAIRNELANRRQGTACTKTRKEVHGTNQKPWRQKGTGRARAGDRKSPVWVGGGTAFGPKPRDYSYAMPRQQKRLALKSLLSLKLKEDKLRVVEDIAIESGKTKDLVEKVKTLSKLEKTVIIINGNDVKIKRAGSNLPWLRLLEYNRLNAHDLFYSEHVFLCENAAGSLNSFYGEKK